MPNVEKYVQPGELESKYTFSSAEEIELQVERVVLERARELGFFDAIKQEIIGGPVDASLIGVDELPAPQNKTFLALYTITGAVSSAPQAIEIPESCTYLKIETSGRAWVSTSGQAANALQTLAQAAAGYSIAIVGNGAGAMLKKPASLKTVYVSAAPDASEVSITFYSGTFIPTVTM